MKVKFFWSRSELFDVINPVCNSSSSQLNYKDCISSFLINENGQGLEYLRVWMAQGLQLAEAVQQGVLKPQDWCEGWWGVWLDTAGTKVYWAGKDPVGYEDEMPLRTFIVVLRAWIQFISQEPDEGKKEEFVVAEF